MQPINTSRKKIAIILIGGFIGLIVVVSVIAFLLKSNENQFGKFIPIKNYDAKIKNIPSAVKDATESYLYTVVKMNVSESVDPGRINDAFIREGSDTQQKDKDVYKGSYIVDIASIKQSYGVSYLYSDDDSKMGGNPIVVSCLAKDKLIYGEFTCKDIMSQQARPNDTLMRYLPYENFSYSITPDATRGEKLTLVVKLDIPQVDLKGNAASRSKVVALYKQEVTKWITSKGVKLDDYVIEYNYDDSGNLIKPTGSY